MTITVQLATTADISRIAEIYELAFKEEIAIDQIEKCFQLNTHKTYIAYLNDKIVGFTDCFYTKSITGQPRLELDLLAIHPDYQGQSIGRHIINYVTQNTNNAALIRALVASNNHPMQKAMTKTGFTQLPDEYVLYIGKAPSEIQPKPENTHIISVDTFSYSGLWLEEHITQQSIQSTQPYINHPDDIVGAVIPTADKSTIETLQSAGFIHIKNFHWWHFAM